MPKPTPSRNKPGKSSRQPATPREIERLLTEQTSVILEAVDERIEQQMGRRLEPVMNKLDAVMKEVQAHREEDQVGAHQLRRHEDRLENHEFRIKKLEITSHQ